VRRAASSFAIDSGSFIEGRRYGTTRAMQRNPRWQVEVSTACAIRAAGL
jgi:hypothetical protein